MINVQPYIDQLEELKDYMDFFIEALWIGRYYKDCHIIEETEQGKEMIEKMKNSKIFPLPMSSGTDISKRLELVEHLKTQMYEYLGIPIEREGKPQQPNYNK